MITLLMIALCMGGLYSAFRYMKDVEREKQKTNYFKNLK